MTATAPGHHACPACGVPVVPGYVRCPKCHASLPFGTGRSKRTTVDPGGTSVEATRPAGVPVMPVVAAIVVGGVIAIGLALHGRKSSAAAVTPGVTITSAPATSTGTSASAPVNTIVLPPPPSSSSSAASVAPTLEIRSALCNDPGVTAAVNDVRTAMRAAGVGRWRCIEESGTLVFDRELAQ